MSETQAPLPVVPYLKIPEAGDPYLEATKCSTCGAVFLDPRRHCSKCGSRDSLEPFRLAGTGTLHAYTIVHRSFPGVPVPYVSAVVDMDGGGVLKSNLVDVEADPEKIQMGMKVAVTYGIAPQKDKEGNEYMAFFFKPAGA